VTRRRGIYLRGAHNSKDNRREGILNFPSFKVKGIFMSFLKGDKAL
jgi:hypothetical protein